MGKLRTDSTDDFPVRSRDSDLNYILVTEDGSEHYKATKTAKSNLLSRLTELEGSDGVELLGVWPSKWRTGIHQLEIPQFIERLENAEL